VLFRRDLPAWIKIPPEDSMAFRQSLRVLLAFSVEESYLIPFGLPREFTGLPVAFHLR